jgi:hypothetical protein
MANFTASIKINVSDNLEKSSKKVAKGFGRMTKAAKLNEKQIARLRKANDKFGQSLTRIGARGALAFAGASIAGFKFASDAAEIRSKFGVVFGGISDQAESTADVFAKEFRLAGSTARQLLGNTGDLLTGFGFTEEAALSLSDKVNRLAGDVASFSNIQGGAKRASAALTKGLLGERESMKELGIVINEELIGEELKKRGLGGLKGRELRAAKAVITFDLAFEQSAKAIGDVARTNESAANQMKEVGERMKEFTEKFGEQVINPLAKDILPAINKFLGDEEKMSKLLGQIKTAAETTATFVQLVYHGVKTVSDFFADKQGGGLFGGTPQTIAGGQTSTAIPAVAQAFSSGIIGQNAPLQLKITLEGDGLSIKDVQADREIDFEIDMGMVLP